MRFAPEHLSKHLACVGATSVDQQIGQQLLCFAAINANQFLPVELNLKLAKQYDLYNIHSSHRDSIDSTRTDEGHLQYLNEKGGAFLP